MAEQEALAARLALLAAPGGPGAALRWVVRKLFRVDAYRVLAQTLTATAQPPTGAWSLAQFCAVTDANIAVTDASLLRQLDANNGCTCAVTTANGGRVYALRSGDDVVCQARVEFGEMRTDTPLPILIHVGPRNAFLSYLHTSAAYRRSGAARALLALIAAHLADEGRWRYCLCHVQSTNVRSLNAFRSAGWRPVAAIWTTKDRLLYVSRGALARSLPLAIERLPENARRQKLRGDAA